MKIIVGLGNPGTQYQLTRHNIGFRILDAFVARVIGNEIKWKKRFFAQVIQHLAEKQKIILAKPQTFMNLSGNAVERISSYYDIISSQLLIIYDDIDLPLGRMRIRLKGSSGGHRGVESIIQSLGTEDFPRLRIGIRNEMLLQYSDYSSFVLSPFLPEEELLLENVFERAVDAITDILDNGYDVAMRKYNQSEKEASQ